MRGNATRTTLRTWESESSAYPLRAHLPPRAERVPLRERKNAHSGGDHHSCRQFLNCFFFVCSKRLHPPRPRDCDVIKAQQAINQIDHVPVTVQCLRWLGRPTTQWWWRQRQQCGNGGGQRTRWQRCGAIDRQWWQHYYISWQLGVAAVTVVG